jgi:hypothetical protein
MIVTPGRHAIDTFSLSAGLVAYWKLDEASGNAVDEISGHTLTNTGTMPYAAALRNNGASFDGTAKYLSMTTPSALKTLGSGFTVSFWYKPSNTTATQRLVANLNGNGNCFIYLGGSGSSPTTIGFILNGFAGAYIAGGAFFTTGTWTHVVCVYDPKQPVAAERLTAWKDGIALINTNSGQDPPQYIASGTADLCVGHQDGATFANGIMDELGIWSRPLSNQEIWILYNDGLSGAGVPKTYPFTESDSSSIVFRDEFDDTDNTLLTSHTPAPTSGGLSWSSSLCTGGTCHFKIVGNQLTMPVNSTTQILTIDPALSDFTLTVNANKGTDPTYSAVAILFRVQDADNYLWWHLKYDGTNTLLKRVAGTYSTVSGITFLNPIGAGGTWGSGNNLTHQFVLKVRSDFLQAYVNGVLHWYVTTSQFSGQTKMGLAQNLPGSESQNAFATVFEVRSGEQFPPYPIGRQ